jgi:DNA-binding beta-propeller fold protein YncE
VAEPGSSEAADATELGKSDEGNTVSVINGATCNATDQSGCNQAVASVTVGRGPFGIALNSATNTIYVANTGELFEGKGGNTVSVIDGATCDGENSSGCRKTPAKVTVGPYPFGVAVDARTNRVFIVNNNGGDGPSSLSVISGSTCDAANISGCSTPPSLMALAGRAPNGVAFEPSSNTLFTANFTDASVSVIKTTERTSAESTPRIAVGSLPSAVAVDPLNHTLYVTNTGSGTVAVLPDHT